MTPTERQRRIIEIDQQLRALRAEESLLRAERQELEEALLEYMMDIGTDSVRLKMPDGSRASVYVHNEIWASAQDVEVLREYPPTSGLVKESVNGQTLSAWVRELKRDENDQPILPAELVDAIRVSPKSTLRTKKA